MPTTRLRSLISFHPVIRDATSNINKWLVSNICGKILLKQPSEIGTPAVTKTS
jgi:hypothetical protein